LWVSKIENLAEQRKQLRTLGTEIASLKELAARRGNSYRDASDAMSGYYADVACCEFGPAKLAQTR
jgi:hypothetical protein